MSGEEPNRDDWLWDRRGPVDAEVARLERLLRPCGFDPARTAQAALAAARARRRRRLRIGLAAAAVFALCAIGGRLWYAQRLQWDAGRPWEIVMQRGDVRIDGRAGAALAPGATLRTGPDAIARLRVARIGELALAGDAELRLVETRSGRHWLQLRQGRLWAKVWAPPGQFGIGLRGVDVFDLGCEFVLDADAAGNGRLTVRSGWVLIDDDHRDVLVPQGATVRLRAGGPAGTPRDMEATPAFADALERIDDRDGRVDADGAEIRALIANARRQDAISLLVLLERHPELIEGPLPDALARLFPEVPAPDRARLRAAGREALSPWWNALPYPATKRWWLKWPDALPAGADTERLLRDPIAG